MAAIPSNKPIKICPLCGKEVRNMGYHIANNHPKALEKLEEDVPPSPPAAPTPTPKGASLPAGDTSLMVREKLETMLNIKLIQMLERGATIEEVQRALNPPPPTAPVGIREIIEYHNLMFPKGQQVLNPSEIPEDNTSDWITLANNALPIIQQIMTARNGGKANDEYRSDESGNTEILKPIQPEAARDTNEPSSFGEESRIIGETTNGDDENPRIID